MAAGQPLPGGLSLGMRTILLAAVFTFIPMAAAHAGPPSYLLLRQAESPGPFRSHGLPAAVYYDVRAEGYAYGYFGAGRRTHWSRGFGVNRRHTQWSRW